MTILTARNGDVDLAWERLGDPQGDPLLLIMGAGAQMVGWPDGFCADLRARRFDVVRFDNRDIGPSTHLDGPAPTRLRRRVSAAPGSPLSLYTAAEFPIRYYANRRPTHAAPEPWHARYPPVGIGHR